MKLPFPQLAEVARRARALRRVGSGGVGLLVAAEAPLHPRELVARGELELAHLAVALRALEALRQVLSVSEDEVGARKSIGATRLPSLGAYPR